jgi:hypothetical protein
MRIPVQGAVIIGATESHGASVIDSPLSPHAVARSIGEVSQALAATCHVHVQPVPLVSGPWVPPPPPVTVYWTIANRWTGKCVSDLLGNEHADSTRAHRFPSEQAAVQFARNITGTPLATARAQPPPDDAPHCYDCGTANARGTVVCGGCHRTIVVATSWITVWPHDADGRFTGPSICV